MSPRYAARKDADHDEIAKAFRSLGWFWQDTYQFAQYVPGFFDGLAVKDGVVIGVEVKSGREPLTPDEMHFHELWPGRVMIVRSVRDVDEGVKRCGGST